MKPLTPKNAKMELPQPISIDEFINECDEIYEKSRHSIGYKNVEFEFENDIAVGLSADWHIGNEMTNHSQWSRDIRDMMSQENIYWILNGDYTDNLDYLKTYGVYEQVMRVPEAKRKVMQAIKFLKDKLLAIVQGCHDEWFYKQDAWEFAQYIADHSTGYWMGFGGTITLIVGEQEYKIYARHKYKRNSSYHVGWGMKYKSYKHHDVDIFFGAHTHDPNIEIFWDVDTQKYIYTVNSGTYKPTDRFLDQQDKEFSPIGVPAVVLRADKKQIIPVTDFREVKDLL